MAATKKHADIRYQEGYREQKLPDFSGTFLFARAASQSLRVHETLATTAIAMRNLRSVFLMVLQKKERKRI